MPHLPIKSLHPDPTGEQQLILDKFVTGNHMVIEAGAGTGKTSTLKMIAAKAETPGLYLAYNRAIAAEAGTKFPPHVPARTAHSMAYRAIGYRFRDRLNGDRVTARQVAAYLGINRVYTEGDKRLSANVLARLVMEMVEKFCQSADTEITLAHRPFVEGIEDQTTLGAALLPWARTAWRELQRDAGGALPFSHDHYLKAFAMTNPNLGVDFVLFDEAQDANPCIANIVAAQDCQKVYVGDRSQSIYGWRGAVDAMDIPGIDKLYLSQSFRFGQPIAEEANRWLAQLDTPLRLTGYDQVASRLIDSNTGNTRAVLCRTNGTAFEILIRAQERDIKAHLMGGGKDIVAFCRGADELKSRGSSTHRDLAAFTTWQAVQDYVTEDHGARDLKVLVTLVDLYGTERILDAMKRMWPDEQTAHLTVSTAHKAKGREWSSVRIADDFRQREDADGQLIELEKPELMLRYVAVTRAQFELDCNALIPRARRTTNEASPHT